LQYINSHLLLFLLQKKETQLRVHVSSHQQPDWGIFLNEHPSLVTVVPPGQFVLHFAYDVEVTPTITL
jgi:hypothetical protein